MRPILALLLMAAPAAAFAQAAPVVEEQSIDQLRAAMASGTSSEAITRAYLARIEAMDRKGPALRAVIAVNPDAIAEAQASDARRKAKKLLGPLDGVPILIKDNIETKDPIATTAGSLALKDNVTNRDAPVVALLRAQGAVILGKTNLSEWANIRSTKAMSGWSAVGGLVRNPVRARPHRLRIVERHRRGDRGELRGGGAGHRDRRVGGLPVVDERAGRAQADASGWSAAPMSCRSAIARTRRGRWRAASGTPRSCSRR